MDGFLVGRKNVPLPLSPINGRGCVSTGPKPKTEEKAQRMANARKAVKRTSTVG